MIVAAIEEVIQFPLRAAIFEAGAVGVVTAAIDFAGAAVFKRAAFGLNIHHAGRAEAVLRRQGAGDELHGIHEARVQFLAETGDALGKEHIVDAVLKVRMFAAHMQAAVRRRVLRHARSTEDNLTEGRIASLRSRFDL